MCPIAASPLFASLGAIVTGCDLRHELPAEQTEQLRQLIRSHYVLVFPGQRLDPADQVRALSMFGPVVGTYSGGPLHAVVAAREEEPIAFHCDYAFTRSPLPFVSLYGDEVTGEVASTAFIDCVAACAELPRPLRDALAGRSVLHASDITGVGQRSTGSLRVDGRRSPIGHGTYHPAILVHPETGREVLFVNQYLSLRVTGLPVPDSDALLAALFVHLYAPHRVHHHRWRAGDLIVFDNLSLQHSRMPGRPRTLRRVVVSHEPLADLFHPPGPTELP